MLISSHLNSRNNNFNLIRFVAAVLVIYTHAYALSGGVEPIGEFFGYSLGTVAVDLFFVTSGFLIMGSLQSSKSLIEYFKKRLFRILPALILVVFFCSFILGPIVSELSFVSYFSNSQVYLYFGKSITLLGNVGTYLPGVFLENPWPRSINGSLWTLPYEMWLYIILAFFVCFSNKIISYLKMDEYQSLPLLFFTVILMMITIWLYYTEHSYLKHFKLVLLFFMGSVYYSYANKIQLSKFIFALVFIIGGVFFAIGFELYIIYLIFLPYILFFAVFELKGSALKFNDFGDYSFGLYIYSFPIQQTLAYVIDDISTLLMMLLSLSLSLSLSILSWHWIEKRFLFRNRSIKKLLIS